MSFPKPPWDEAQIRAYFAREDTRSPFRFIFTAFFLAFVAHKRIAIWEDQEAKVRDPKAAMALKEAWEEVRDEQGCWKRFCSWRRRSELEKEVLFLGLRRFQKRDL